MPATGYVLNLFIGILLLYTNLLLKYLYIKKETLFIHSFIHHVKLSSNFWGIRSCTKICHRISFLHYFLPNYLYILIYGGDTVIVGSSFPSILKLWAFFHRRRIDEDFSLTSIKQSFDRPMKSLVSVVEGRLDHPYGAFSIDDRPNLGTDGSSRVVLKGNGDPNRAEFIKGLC